MNLLLKLTYVAMKFQIDRSGIGSICAAYKVGSTNVHVRLHECLIVYRSIKYKNYHGTCT